MTDLLSDEELLAAWDAMEAGTLSIAPEAVVPRKHYRPLVEAIDDFVHEAQDTHRIYTGIEQLDAEMRGIGRGHMALVVGYTHNGKNLVVHHVLRHNTDKRVAFFTPDETQTLVLAKLAAIESGVAADELEQRIIANDDAAFKVLRDTVAAYPTLAVFEQVLTPAVMEQGYDELCDEWGEAPELVIVDYAKLLQVGDGDVQAKLEWLKAYGKDRRVPMLVLHQTSRTAGKSGQQITIDSGEFGGETLATFVIGVRRKINALRAEQAELRAKLLANGDKRGADQMRYRLDEIERDLQVHKYTVTLNLTKNKRVGGGLVDEFEMELDRATGALHPIPEGELPRQYLATRPRRARYYDEDYDF